MECAAAVADLIGDVLDWDPAQCGAEVENYRARVEAERSSQSSPDDADADALRTAAPEARRYLHTDERV